MASVSFKNVDKIYSGGTKAVSGFSLDIADKEFMVIMGPSGCGKSTLLRLIAGLEKPTSGRIFIDGKDVTDVPPAKRGTAIVMQTNALFPHLSVFDNLAFGLTIAKTDKQTIKQTVLKAAEALGITDLLDRKPSSLSGGQRQRVALGRALAVRPRVFLLDEPLSNLDASLKSVMRAEIKRLHKEAETTFVYVTHDRQEAMSLGGRVAVLNAGELQQAGTPRQVYDRPENKFTAGFIGTPEMNFFDAEISAGKTADSLTLCFCERKMQIKADCLPRDFLMDGEKKCVTAGIRPEDVLLAVKESANANATDAELALCGADKTAENIADNADNADNANNADYSADNTDNTNNADYTADNAAKDYYPTSATLSLIEPAGGENIIHAALCNTSTIVLKSPPHFDAPQGKEIKIIINKSKLRFFDKQTGKALS